MGRHKASQSRKREEKSKVKLKVQKTKFLPKGQNLTDTRFKVRKIVIPDQLKTRTPDQPLTKKKLSVQDVLGKFRHHNTSHRREGLQGLRELLTEADGAFFSLNLGNIICSLSKLVLDPEREVRHDACKTLRLVLAQALDKVEPFFDTLSSYLVCAMTHIQINIQEDSLLFLDVLLEYTPFLISKSAQHVLPCFLDMISRLRSEKKPHRLLSVNLSGKLSAVQWRLHVLHRLQLLLTCMMENYKKVIRIENDIKIKDFAEKSISYLSEEKMFHPIYNDNFSQECDLQVFSQTGAAPVPCLVLRNADEFISYIDTLTDLLIECWLEVCPDVKRDDKAISSEAAVLLSCTFEIMQLLWDYLQLWEKDNLAHNLESWFREKYLTTLSRYFLPGFPYFREEIETTEKGGPKWRNKKLSGEVVPGVARPHCISQNLALCQLFIEMSTSMKAAVANPIISYITECLGKENLGNAESRQLVAAVRSVFKKHNLWFQCRVSLDPLMLAMVTRCSSQNHWLEQQLSEILLQVIQIDFDRKFQSVSVVEKWICTLPRTLCRRSVSSGMLRLFSKLARQKNTAFLNALQQELPNIIGNLWNLSNSSEDASRCLSSLFYQIPKWSVGAKRQWVKLQESGNIPTIVREIVSLKNEQV